MVVENGDYVYRDPYSDYWDIRITIPERAGELVILTKDPLSDDERSYLDRKAFRPLEDGDVINFCIRKNGAPECSAMVLSNP